MIIRSLADLGRAAEGTVIGHRLAIDAPNTFTSVAIKYGDGAWYENGIFLFNETLEAWIGADVLTATDELEDAETELGKVTIWLRGWVKP